MSVQDELSHKEEEMVNKVVAITSNTMKMSAEHFKAMLERYINSQNEKSPKLYKGKQTVKQLAGSGNKLTNIEITEQNIKSFSRVARKYGIDFALKKDISQEPPKYLIFFKAKDIDVLNAAFKEFVGRETTKAKKPSICKKLKNFIQKTISNAKERSREKKKDKDMEL